MGLFTLCLSVEPMEKTSKIDKECTKRLKSKSGTIIITTTVNNNNFDFIAILLLTGGLKATAE